MKQLVISLGMTATGIVNRHGSVEVAKLSLSDQLADLIEQGEALAHFPGAPGDVVLSLSQNFPLPIPVVGLLVHEKAVESIELKIVDVA